MTTHFSDHFTSDSSSDVITRERDHRPSAGIAHARLRKSRSRISLDTAFGVGDIAQMCKLKSGDRIFGVSVISDGGSTAGAADLGVYKVGVDGTLTAIDVDLFADALATSAAIARVDQFKEAGTLEDADRGKPFWELADEGDGTYASDPLEEWAICFTGTTAFTVAATEIVLEVEYTSGD